jgi:hypothetical protein
MRLSLGSFSVRPRERIKNPARVDNFAAQDVWLIRKVIFDGFRQFLLRNRVDGQDIFVHFSGGIHPNTRGFAGNEWVRADKFGFWDALLDSFVHFGYFLKTQHLRGLFADIKTEAILFDKGHFQQIRASFQWTKHPVFLADR